MKYFWYEFNILIHRIIYWICSGSLKSNGKHLWAQDPAWERRGPDRHNTLGAVRVPPLPTPTPQVTTLLWFVTASSCCGLFFSPPFSVFTHVCVLPRWLSKESACFHPWVGKVPWRRQWQPTPVFSPGESHGQRSLVGHSPGVTRSRAWLGDSQQHVCTSPSSVSLTFALSFIKTLSYCIVFRNEVNVAELVWIVLYC